MSDSNLSLSPTPELPEADHNDATSHPLEDPQDDPTAQLADPNSTNDAIDNLSDDESVLSEVDEAQFEDFDPNQITIEERAPVAVDEDNVKLIGRHKRKRDEADGEGKKKKKLQKRDKPKKGRKRKDSDDEFSGGQEVEGKRVRKKKAFVDGEGRGEDLEGRKKKEKARKEARRAVAEEEEAELDPEERESIHSCILYCFGTGEADRLSPGRRRALDRAMDAALKGPKKIRRRAGEVVCPMQQHSLSPY